MNTANNSQNSKTDELHDKRAKSVRQTTVNQNYLTSMRNKVEEDSRQLKHEVAQQIIASNTIRVAGKTGKQNTVNA